MSKSYGNAIMLTDPEPVVRQKLKTMVTDPARIRRTDPGNPDICPVGDLHKIFSSKETMAKVYEGCRSAGIGCIECKSWAADALVKILNPMQERRKKYEDNPRLAWDILEAGSARAREVAGATMDEVRSSMGLDYTSETPDQRRIPRSDGFVATHIRTGDSRGFQPRRGSGGRREQAAPQATAQGRASDFPLPSNSAKSTKARSTCCST